MSGIYNVLTQKDLQSTEHRNLEFSTDVLIGLSRIPKKLSSKYFYDEEGNRIFRKIMELPEYYLTRCEIEIITECKERILHAIGKKPIRLIEFGSGDGRKTNILLEYFLNEKLDFQYVPIDISEDVMSAQIREISAAFPSVNAEGIVAEYFDGLKWLNMKPGGRNLVLFLGSNIGNFDRAHSNAFLHNLWSSLNSGDIVVIGFDLKKDIDLMLKAYNDSQGITAEFNLNLLKRINRELGGEFDVEKFRYYAGYDVFSGAIESYLVSLEKQTVFIPHIGQSFSFDSWEPIHTEYSYKYLESDIEQLAANTGFSILDQLYDSRKYFVDSVWRVEKFSMP